MYYDSSKYGVSQATIWQVLALLFSTLPTLVEPLMFAKPGGTGETVLHTGAIENQFYCFKVLE